MNNPSFIDTLSAIQTAVRDGVKWEYRSILKGEWQMAEDQSEAQFTWFIKMGYTIRLT